MQEFTQSGNVDYVEKIRVSWDKSATRSKSKHARSGILLERSHNSENLLTERDDCTREINKVHSNSEAEREEGELSPNGDFEEDNFMTKDTTEDHRKIVKMLLTRRISAHVNIMREMKRKTNLKASAKLKARLINMIKLRLLTSKDKVLHNNGSAEYPWMVDGAGLPPHASELLPKMVKLTKKVTSQVKQLARGK